MYSIKSKHLISIDKKYSKSTQPRFLEALETCIKGKEYLILNINPL